MYLCIYGDVAEYQDSQMTTIQDRLKRASEARKKFVMTGETAYEGPTGTQTREEIEEAMSHLQPGTLYHDGLEYYGITHAHPNSVSRYTTASLMDLMTWDATSRYFLYPQCTRRYQNTENQS